MSKTIILALVLLAFSTPAFAQKRKPVKNKPATPNISKTYCDGDKIPDGYVVVANDPNGQCKAGGTLKIAKVMPGAIVCVGSPVPDGYSVQSQTGSRDCRGASANPIANAFRLSGGTGLWAPDASGNYSEPDDSVSIQAVKTDIQDYFDKEIVIEGKLSLSTYFFCKYEDVKENYYAMTLSDDTGSIEVYAKRQSFVGSHVRDTLLSVSGKRVSARGRFTIVIQRQMNDANLINVCGEILSASSPRKN